MSDLERRAARIVAAKRAIRAASVDGIERRHAPLSIELRNTDTDGDAYTMVGHAAVFNDLSEDLGFFEEWYERIAPGAFAGVLDAKPDVRALFNHDPNIVLARTTNGTLRLEEDEQGLRYEADVAPTTWGNDLRVLLERGDVNQSSFAFRGARKGDSWDEDDEGRLIRTIERFSDLFDVSPVTYPAYLTTDVGAASHTVALERIARNLNDTTSSPDSEREAERVAATTADMAEAGAADGTSEGHSRAFVRRDLAARGRLLDA